MIEIKIEDNLYPRLLKEISDAPQKLFVEGDASILNDISISVIGSRHHSEYGKKMCQKFTKELVENNISIVSGMALGIDAIAHSTCLMHGGKTIAVLPSGLNKIYPKENEELYHSIIKNGGAIISEYLPNEEYEIKKPIERNRIVSALSIGTLVIEAGYRSGTSVTARLAMNQGKNVFCIPSSLENSYGCTSNEIIKKGGKLVTCIDDILNEYLEFSKEKIDIENNEIQEKTDINMQINNEYLDVYNVILYEPLHINDICKKLPLSISEINYKLMMLELEGNIIQLPGKYFVRK